VNPICPYCRTEVGVSAEERLDCPACATPHHPECFAENGGCTVFGCASAPAAEAKISVSGAELNQDTGVQPGAARILGDAFSVLHAAAPASADPPMGAANSPAPSPSATAAAPPPPISAGTGAAPPPLAGVPRAAATAATPAVVNYMSPGARPKSRVTFVLLGIFLGLFGAHNFYAGYHKKAGIQAAITVVSCFYGAIVSWIWAIVEVCVISKDADGESFG